MFVNFYILFVVLFVVRTKTFSTPQGGAKKFCPSSIWPGAGAKKFCLFLILLFYRPDENFFYPTRGIEKVLSVLLKLASGIKNGLL